MIQNRLYNISSDENMFNQEFDQYNDAIKEAGYEDMKLKYEKPVK